MANHQHVYPNADQIPSSVDFTGEVKTEYGTFRYVNGKLHGELEPAILWKDGTVGFFLNGVETPYSVWFKKAVQNPTVFVGNDGGSILPPSGYFTGVLTNRDRTFLQFFVNGKWQSTNGNPSYYTASKVAWEKDNRYDRTDGPAEVWQDNWQDNREVQDYWNKTGYFARDREAWAKSLPVGTEFNPRKVPCVCCATDEFSDRDTYTGVVVEKGSSETIVWFKDGKIHRDDGGPAIYDKHGYKAWLKNNEFHREDGPAKIYSDGNEYYYLNGEIFYSRNEWLEHKKKKKNQQLNQEPEASVNEPKPQQEEKTETMSQQSLLDKINFQKESEEAAYRTARNELLKLVRGYILDRMAETQKTKKQQEAVRNTFEAFFQTELGGAVILGMAGGILPAIEDKIPEFIRTHFVRLGKEFRVSAMAATGNEIVEKIQTSLGPNFLRTLSSFDKFSVEEVSTTTTTTKTQHSQQEVEVVGSNTSVRKNTL